MALLVAVFEAEVGASVTQIKITEAVALLIRKAVFSRTVPQLDDSWACAYVLLASLHLGRRVVKPSQNALFKLRLFLIARCLRLQSRHRG